MKPTTGLIALIVISLIILTIFFGQTVFSAVRNQVGIFLANFTSNSGSGECGFLARENERLKFELLKYKEKEGRETESGLTAEVFSRYPFNDKERLVVNLDGDDIENGLPVLSPGGYLLGKISAVGIRRSEVQTIFDSEWKSSVAIGDAKTKAVLKGGQPPKLELIPKDAEVKEGEAVFNISPDFPYKKLIGKIQDIKENAEKTWHTASIQVPYTLDEITEIIVLTENF